ncbi:MAG: hypothetical protein Q9164_007231, partial [Protoblastenia rupestris]
MAATQYLKKIALVGASGQLGTPTLKHLLEQKKFDITLLTRQSSAATFPTDDSITVRAVDYSDKAALVSALQGQQAIVLMLGFEAIPQQEIELIEAAIEAGVTYILPTEFGADNANTELANMVPLNAAKAVVRAKAEELGKKTGAGWIGISNNAWFDYSFKHGNFGIDPKARTATLYDGGKTFFASTLISETGLAIARLLSLPISQLDTLKNKYIYIANLRTNQRQILDAVQTVTKTTDADWKIEHADAREYLDSGIGLMGKGEFMAGMVRRLYGSLFVEGLGGDFETIRGLDNEMLGLEKKDLVEI